MVAIWIGLVAWVIATVAVARWNRDIVDDLEGWCMAILSGFIVALVVFCVAAMIETATR